MSSIGIGRDPFKAGKQEPDEGKRFIIHNQKLHTLRDWRFDAASILSLRDFLLAIKARVNAGAGGQLTINLTRSLRRKRFLSLCCSHFWYAKNADLADNTEKHSIIKGFSVANRVARVLKGL